MPDVTASAAQIGQMLLHAFQDALHLGPDQALASAQAEAGITTDDIDQADLSDVLEYMCQQPGVSAELQQYLQNVNNTYGSNNTVNQGGSTYTGGGGGGGYGGGSAGGGSNAQIVQQVTQNYYEQEINDNHIEVIGGDGPITIDQDNDHVEAGDNSAVNTGDGDQNAATGDHSSAAQANGDGNAQSGSGVLVDGDNDGPIVQGDVGGNVTDFDNSGGTITDSSLGFGDGTTTGDIYNEEGAATSIGGDATGQSVETNTNSDVNEEHGDGDNNELDLDLGHPREPVLLREADDDGIPQHHEDAPDVTVNVEGGAGDQHVHEPAPEHHDDLPAM